MLRVTENYLVMNAPISSSFLLANKTNLSVDRAKKNDNNSNACKEMIDAFMHYTYKETNQNLIVFDVRTLMESYENSIVLTEPIIFSVDANRYGASNLGESGIKLFMDQHCCNSICSILERKQPKKYVF